MRIFSTSLGGGGSVSFPIQINQGGTGQTTQTLAFNALSPQTTKGDLIAFDGTNSVRQAVGTDGKILSANSAQSAGLEWIDPPASSPLTTKGDLYTYTTANARLAVGTTLQILTSDSSTSTGLKWQDQFSRYSAGNSGATLTLDIKANGYYQYATMTGATVSILFGTDPVLAGTPVVLELVQDNPGGRVAIWPASVKWPSSTAPILSTGVGKRDLINLLWTGSDYLGSFSLNY